MLALSILRVRVHAICDSAAFAAASGVTRESSNRGLCGSVLVPVAESINLVRFPTWMWRNAEVDAFIRWLREHNAVLGPAQRVRLV
jgi:erythromycin esterase-like protein